MELPEDGAREKVTGLPVGHCSVNAVPVALTALLKLNVTVVDSGRLFAPLTGAVLDTEGGVSMVNENV